MSDEIQGPAAIPNAVPNANRLRGVVTLVVVAGLLLALDLWSKYASFDRLLLSPIERNPLTGRVLFVQSDEIPFIQSWLHFRVTVNEGAIFGIGQGKRWLFVVVSIVAIGLLTTLAARGGKWIQHATLGLLLAGVLGNLYDRWHYGYVRDMLYALPGRTYADFWLTRTLTPQSLHASELFPWIFNLADCFLVCGVVLLLLQSFFTPQEKTVAQP